MKELTTTFDVFCEATDAVLDLVFTAMGRWDSMKEERLKVFEMIEDALGTAPEMSPNKWITREFEHEIDNKELTDREMRHIEQAIGKYSRVGSTRLKTDVTIDTFFELAIIYEAVKHKLDYSAIEKFVPGIIGSIVFTDVVPPVFSAIVRINEGIEYMSLGEFSKAVVSLGDYYFKEYTKSGRIWAKSYGSKK